jgi:hypothetical protein
MKDEAARVAAQKAETEILIQGNPDGEIINTTAGGESEAETRFRKQITPEKIVGKILQDWIPNKGEEPRWLFSIYGQVEGFSIGQTQFGPYMKLTGEFLAKNYLTGVETDGPVAILPALGEMIVRNQLRAVGFGTPNGPRAVVFGMEIGIEYNKPDEFEINGDKVTVKKYSWAIRPIGARAKTSLRMVRDMMESQRLAAPEVATVAELIHEAEAPAAGRKGRAAK